MDIMEVQFMGGPLDGFSYAYTRDDLPLPSIRFEGRQKYRLNSLQLIGWNRPRFIYLHESLSVLTLNLAK